MVAPHLWNAIPLEVCLVPAFRCQSKACFVTQAFHWSIAFCTACSQGFDKFGSFWLFLPLRATVEHVLTFQLLKQMLQRSTIHTHKYWTLWFFPCFLLHVSYHRKISMLIANFYSRISNLLSYCHWHVLTLDFLGFFVQYSFNILCLECSTC